MTIDQFSHAPHRRYNPLTGEWLLVSPQRATRPWQGQVEATPDENRPQYDPTCYLCPGNARSGGVRNPDYDETFVFDNDFPALRPDTEPGEDRSNPLFQVQAERGVCRVICFSPRHDWTFARMPAGDIRRVVDVWADQTTTLARDFPWLTYVQVFENRGEMMGASNPHPHGQLWATERLPREVEKEDRAQRAYAEKFGRTMLADVAEQERRLEERIVFGNDHWTVLVPFWAVWPFETLLIPQRAVRWIEALSGEERDGLADALSRLTIRYDNLFQTSFPYSMGFHQAPVNSGGMDHWHLHAHFYPPLLRSATIKKHMVGYEMLATPQRDMTAEQAAARLRGLAEARFG